MGPTSNVFASSANASATAAVAPKQQQKTRSLSFDLNDLSIIGNRKLK